MEARVGLSPTTPETVDVLELNYLAFGEWRTTRLAQSPFLSGTVNYFILPPMGDALSFHQVLPCNKQRHHYSIMFPYLASFCLRTLPFLVKVGFGAGFGNPNFLLQS